MKNDANIRNFIEISRNLYGKSRKMRGKSRNFRGIHSSTSSRMTHFRGRFRSFSRSFSVIPGYDSEWFRFLSVFFPFLFLFIPLPPQITPILCSTASFSVNFSHRAKISPFFFWRFRIFFLPLPTLYR